MGRVRLYCPSNKKSVDGFVIGAYQKPKQVLQGVRLALDIKYAALYTIEAKHVTDPQTLQEDDRVLVAASKDETMLPDAPGAYILYDGEESEDVNPDIEGHGQDWEDLSDHEKCLHITSLTTQKPTTRNKMRITRPYKSVQADINTLNDTALTQPQPSASDSSDMESAIETRWAIPLETFLPAHMKPPTAKHTTSLKSLSASTLAALAIYSSFTHGQARLAREVLEEAVALRTEEDQGDDKDPVVRTDDVVNAVKMVYERAGVIPAKLTKGKSSRLRERRKGKKKAAGMGA